MFEVEDFYTSFLLQFAVLSLSKSLWLYILTAKYPHLEFVKVDKIRNILDSNRNQSIIHVLLHIEGQCDIDIVKEALSNYVLERTNRDGILLYPKLRQSFSKAWGYYAWLRNER